MMNFFSIELGELVADKLCEITVLPDRTIVYDKKHPTYTHYKKRKRPKNTD